MKSRKKRYTQDAIKEMEKKGYLKKTSSLDDGRITYISVTKAGRERSKKYDAQYFSDLAVDLTDISEEDADCMIAVIEKFYQVMCERRDKE